MGHLSTNREMCPRTSALPSVLDPGSSDRLTEVHNFRTVFLRPIKPPDALDSAGIMSLPSFDPVGDEKEENRELEAKDTS